GVELLLARVPQSHAQLRKDLRARAAVHEDDEAEAEALLVRVVELGKLCEDGWVVAVLLGRALADARMRRERLDLLVLAQAARDVARTREWIVLGRELLDEARPSAEQLRELVDRQLPRYVAHEYGETSSGTWWSPKPSSSCSSTRVKNGDGGWKTSRYVPASTSASCRTRPSASVFAEATSSSPRKSSTS